MCLLLRLSLVLLTLWLSASDLCFAQNEVSETDQAVAGEKNEDEAGAERQKKQRTFVTGMAALVGIALAGLLLLFIVVLLGARTRRMARAGTGGRDAVEAVPQESASAEEADPQEVEPSDEDET